MEARHGFWSGKRVCVTGGTGFLGYQLVRQLLGLGAEVRVLTMRPAMPHPVLETPNVDMVFGDVRDRAVVRAALAGCEVIFHTAAIVAVWGARLERMYAVHVEGTRNVLDEASAKARVIHTSSVVTIGASLTTVPLREESDFNLADLKVDYVHAKRAAERIALEASGEKDVVVVNPGYLIGPEDYEPSVMGRFCKRYWQGRVPLAPPGGFNLVDVRDVARGHLLAAERGKAGRRYILGGENRTFPEFMIRLAGAMGNRPRAIWTLPGWALWSLACVAECRGWLLHKEPYPSLQHARLNHYHWFYGSDRAEQELGFRARSVTASLIDAYEWHSREKEFHLRGFNRWWMGGKERRAA
jgi:dihydroflavonol-4-reductase